MPAAASFFRLAASPFEYQCSSGSRSRNEISALTPLSVRKGFSKAGHSHQKADNRRCTLMVIRRRPAPSEQLD